MTWRYSSLSIAKGWYLFFFAAGLIVVTGAGLLQSAPGYMDADYYYVEGKLLADGHGFYQPFLWNYLDQTRSLPAPSHTFWMPLVSILVVPAYTIFQSFTGSRILLWILAAMVPPVTVFLGIKFHGKRGLAIVGGLLALFPAYYTVYMPGTDLFAIYMLLGSAFLLAAAWNTRLRLLQPLLIGVLSGLMHMTRADGILWLGAGLAWIAWSCWQSRKGVTRWFVALLICLALCMTGYLLVASPWYARNLVEFGRLMPPGGSRAIWLTGYEDLFVYPAELLTMTRWLEAGWLNKLAGWWQAFSANMQTLIAVQGSTVLAPFILVGLYQLRKNRLVRLAAMMWVVTLLIFTFIFPYQGINGSFFHSGSAIQLVFWAAAPVGIARLIEWVARLRKWERGKQVQRFVEILIVGVCFLLSAGMYYQRIAGTPEAPAWGSGIEKYQKVEQVLLGLGAAPGEVVMVNNPPGYYLANERPAVVIPYGDEGMVKKAAAQFAARYLLLDENNSGQLDNLYLQPGSFPGFHYLTTSEGVRIYEFIAGE